MDPQFQFNNRLLANRRRFLGSAAALGSLFAVRGLFAEELTKTPPLTEGPFYPDKLPLDTDNDLLILNDSTTPAVGEITHLSGRVLGPTGSPIRSAYVEIWQCDHHGAYLHADSSNADKRDANFQGYGRFLTDAKGRYYFRTIKPVPYPGRTPHIHFGISRNGKRIFTSQLLIKGEQQNERDGIFRAIQDEKLRAALCTDFTPLPDSRIGELQANWDIVLGRTPEDPDDAPVPGGVGKPERDGGADGETRRGRGRGA
jgi:protocatechuate 3,4-dioxygenase beta subunit